LKFRKYPALFAGFHYESLLKLAFASVFVGLHGEPGAPGIAVRLAVAAAHRPIQPAAHATAGSAFAVRDAILAALL